MRATSLGHAGILVEAEHGSIVCDPWFVPAFFGSWFPFPRNDQLDDDLAAGIEGADYLYVSHLHGDHWDGGGAPAVSRARTTRSSPSPNPIPGVGFPPSSSTRPSYRPPPPSACCWPSRPAT